MDSDTNRGRQYRVRSWAQRVPEGNMDHLRPTPPASAEEKSSLRSPTRGKFRALIPVRKKRPSASPAHQHVDSGGSPAPEDARNRVATQQVDSDQASVSQLGKEHLDSIPTDLVALQPSSTNVFWPEDLLAPDFPDLRILTFGYESAYTQFLGSVSQNNVFTLSRNLLTSPVNVRASNVSVRNEFIKLPH